MENMTSALKMAFAILGFIMAISILFYLISRTTEMADIILFYVDDTNYYEWTSGPDRTSSTIMYPSNEDRIVGEETVISALYAMSNNETEIHIYSGSREIYPDKTVSLGEFIKKELDKGYTYKEEVIEIMETGNYRYAADGTRITLEPGSSKIYLIYTKQ